MFEVNLSIGSSLPYPPYRSNLSNSVLYTIDMVFRITFINEFIITVIYTGSDVYIPSQLTRHSYANHRCR